MEQVSASVRFDVKSFVVESLDIKQVVD